MLDHYALVDDLIVLARVPESGYGPDPARLLAFAERLEAGDIGYAGAGPEIDGLRTDARPER